MEGNGRSAAPQNMNIEQNKDDRKKVDLFQMRKGARNREKERKGKRRIEGGKIWKHTEPLQMGEEPELAEQGSREGWKHGTGVSVDSSPRRI